MLASIRISRSCGRGRAGVEGAGAPGGGRPGVGRAPRQTDLWVAQHSRHLRICVLRQLESISLRHPPRSRRGNWRGGSSCRLPTPLRPTCLAFPARLPKLLPPRPSQGVSHARMQLRGGSHPSSRDPASDTHRGKMLPQRPHEQAKEFFQLGLALGPQRRAAQLNNPPNALIAHWSAPLPWRAPFSDPFGAARKSPLPAGPPWLPPSRARVTGSCGPASLQPAAAHLCGAWDSP